MFFINLKRIQNVVTFCIIKLLLFMKAFNKRWKMNEEFSKIFNTFRQDIFRLIYSYTLNIDDSKDILQETFVELYKNILSLPDDELIIKKWLMRVAINKSKNYNKCFWKRKVTNYEDEKKSYSFSNLKTNVEIFDTLKSLEKKYRIPLYLYYFEGYSILEIANILKLSESGIKMRLKRAKNLLKKEMERI